MSWIVQNLLSKKEEIRSKSHPTIADASVEFNTYENRDLLYITDSEQKLDKNLIEVEPMYDDPFIENEQFNDLLVIEKAIEELTDLNLLTPSDLEVLEREGGGNYNRRNRNRKTHSKRFSLICDRIAYFLGDYFTDEGYVNYLADKYHLSERQIETMRLYMKSKFKNKILRKGYKIKNEKNTANVPA